VKSILKFILKGTLVVFSLFLLLGFYGLMFLPSPEQRAKWAAEAAARDEAYKADVAKQAEADKAKAAALAADTAATAAYDAKHANDLSPWVAEHVVRRRLRDPDSATFGKIDVYSDRNLGKLPVQVACGSVNSKNGFGGYSGNKDFLLVDALDGILLIDTDTNNGKFVKWWNKLCAGEHTAPSDRQARSR
jgi:hypothetical protein